MQSSPDLQTYLLLPLEGGAAVILSAELGIQVVLTAQEIQETGGGAGFFNRSSLARYETLLEAGMIDGPRVDIVENLLAGTPDRPVEQIARVSLTLLGSRYLSAFQAYRRLKGEIS